MVIYNEIERVRGGGKEVLRVRYTVCTGTKAVGYYHVLRRGR